MGVIVSFGTKKRVSMSCFYEEYHSIGRCYFDIDYLCDSLTLSAYYLLTTKFNQNDKA